MNEVSVHTRSHHTVSDTVEIDITLVEKQQFTCQVRRLGGGVYVVQASWSMEDHGSVRRVSLGGR
jgi:hypothetical protein